MQDLHRMMINRLKKYDRMESLWTLWAYYHNAYYDKEFPVDITPHPVYLKDKKNILNISKSIVALREIVCYTRYRASPIYKWIMQPANFWTFWDTLNEMNNIQYWTLDSVEENKHATFELFRMGQQQFKWQTIIPNPLGYHGIHYFLYTDPNIGTIIKNQFWLTTLEFYGIGWILLSELRNKFWLKYDMPISGDYKNLSIEKIQLFYDIMAEDIDLVKTKILSKIQYDEGFEFYGMKELLSTPLLKISKQWNIYYVSPISDLLMRSIGETLFFKLLNLDNKFSGYYWARFQSLCLKNIQYSFANSESAIHFGVDNDLILHDWKKTWVNTDFFLHDDTGLIFMDAKTKMIPEKIYVQYNEKTLDDEVTIWVKEILMQSYETIWRYLKWDFSHCIKPWYADIYPVILTLNDLHLWLGLPWYGIYDKIDIALKTQFKNSWIPDAVLVTYPYMFISINELPKFNELIKLHWISKVMNISRDPKYKNYWIDWIIREFFPEFSFEGGIVTDADLAGDILGHFKA